MQAPASSSARPVDALRPSTFGARRDPAWVVLRASVLAIVVGILLGELCFTAMQGGTSVAEDVAAGLADLGSPWVLTAFAVGAGTVDPQHRRRHWAYPLAAVSGAVALFVATAVYYRLTPDRLLAELPSYIAFWLAVALAVGAAVGAAGAFWRVHRHQASALVPAVAIGAIVSGEAVFAWQVGFQYSRSALPYLLAGLCIAGPLLAASLVTAPRRLIALVVTAAFVVPASVVIVSFSELYRPT